MDWLNLHTSTLDSPEFIGSDPTQRATWLCLQRFCIGQENGGRIADCSGWPDRRWQQLCRVTRREVLMACALWSWDGDCLTVWNYPADKEQEVRANRENGRKGGRPPKPEDPATKTHGKPPGLTLVPDLQNPPVPDGRNGKEGNGKKEKGNGKAASSESSKPSSLAEAVEFFATMSVPADEAGIFFDHYEANGWCQSGKTPLRSWQAAASKWARKWKKERVAAQKSSVGAAGANYDPKAPNATTGGVPVFN